MSADGDGFKHFRQPEAEWYPAAGARPGRRRGHGAVLRRFFSPAGRGRPRTDPPGGAP